MLSALAVFMTFSILVVVHEFGHFIMARKCGVKVEKFSLGFGPKIASIKKGDTEYRLSLIPFGGYIKMAGETHEDRLTGASWEFLSKSPGERFKIIICGPILNYILGFVLFSIVFMIGAPTLTNGVGEVIDNHPAKQAGIIAGDRIVSIDGEKIEYWHELTENIHGKLEGRINVGVLRDNRVFQVNVKPQIKELKDVFGKSINIAMIGIRPSDELVYIKHGPIESVRKGALKVWDLTTLTFKALWNLVIGRLSLKESVTGPVGIVVLTAKAAKLGIVYLINIMAIISTSLAIFNVLPVPVLDGGHLLFLGIEKIRRKPLSEKVQGIATQIGLGLLLMLMLYVFYFDIAKFFSK